MVAIYGKHVEAWRHALNQISNSKAFQANLPVMLLFHILGGDTCWLLKIVKEIENKRKIESPKIALQAQLDMKAVHR
ncbi:MAG: hypothetical protein C4294_17975 [Nitrospiraceae bacterium]